MMTLYEVTNGWMGESYVRAYAWADSKEHALSLAREAYRGDCLNAARHKSYALGLKAKPLMTPETPPFCTPVSDCGWETEDES